MDELELNYEQIRRLDVVDNGAHNFLLTLTEKTEEELAWDMEIIGPMVEMCKNYIENLPNRSLKVRYPGIVTDANGKQHYAE